MKASSRRKTQRALKSVLKAIVAPAGKPQAAPKTRQAQVQLIKAVVARSEETKFRSELILNSVAFNSAIVDADITRCLPKLVQDQGQGASYERMGSKISVRKLKIDADICLTDVTRSGALVVHYWLLTHKEQKQTANLGIGTGGVDMGTFLKTGDGSEVQNFNGYAQDAMLPVNQAKFRVLKHGSFLLGKNTGVVQDVTTAGNQPMYGNHIRHALSMVVKTPKTFTYEQDGNTPRTVFYPSGFAPFIVFGYHHQNHTVPDVANQDISVTLRSSLYYDDA